MPSYSPCISLLVLCQHDDFGRGLVLLGMFCCILVVHVVNNEMYEIVKVIMHEIFLEQLI